MSSPSLVQSFNFLEKLQYIPVSTIDTEDRDCIICLESYDKGTVWHQNDTVNHPVKLANCRHIFGLQCLARFMFSPNFDGCCPICRTQIVSTSATEPDSQANALSTLIHFMALIQSELTVGKVAFWKIVKGHDMWRGRELGQLEYRIRIEMLLDEYADALCGGSKGFADLTNAMDAREQRHRVQLQAWADSQAAVKRQFHDELRLVSMCGPLTAVPMALLVFHAVITFDPILVIASLDLMLMLSISFWALATGLVLRKRVLVEKDLIYGMPIVLGFLIYYAAFAYPQWK